MAEINCSESASSIYIKCLLVGDSSTSKTCLISRIMDDNFIESQQNIGLRIKHLAVELKHSLRKLQTVKYGLHEYPSPYIHIDLKDFCKHVNVVWIHFAINNRNSFLNTRKWFYDVIQYFLNFYKFQGKGYKAFLQLLKKSRSIQFYLIATKIDLPKNEYTVEHDEIQDYLKRFREFDLTARNREEAKTFQLPDWITNNNLLQQINEIEEILHIWLPNVPTVLINIISEYCREDLFNVEYMPISARSGVNCFRLTQESAKLAIQLQHQQPLTSNDNSNTTLWSGCEIS